MNSDIPLLLSKFMMKKVQIAFNFCSNKIAFPGEEVSLQPISNDPYCVSVLLLFLISFSKKYNVIEATGEAFIVIVSKVSIVKLRLSDFLLTMEAECQRYRVKIHLFNKNLRI